jgi:hypothetical protein
MPSNTFTFIAALATLIASAVAVDDSNMQCVLNPNPPAGANCAGGLGYLTNENSLDSYTTDPEYTSSPAACALSCSERANCVSWYLGIQSDPFCEWHTDTLAAAGWYSNSGSWYYGYDQACFTCGPKTVQCPSSDGSTFTTGAATFEVSCGTDYYGGDMGYVTTDTFEECMTSCASAIGCVDVAYNGNTCYMKNTLNTPRQDANVWGAVLVSAANDAAATVTCPGSNGATHTTSSGRKYTVQCGVDYYGNDINNEWVETFEDCLDACDSTLGCVDIALNGNNCYLKTGGASPQQNSAVWGASLVSNQNVQVNKRRDSAAELFKRDVAPTSKHTPGVEPVSVE